jgi:DNA-binding SARP family transcriptional activator/nucleotide-binding universal stress UspA family protein
MEFRILGPLEVWHDDRRLPLTGEKRCALLALLLLNANRVVPSARLMDELWGDDPPETGAKALQMHVSQLRKALEVDPARAVLVTRPQGYLVKLEPEELDLERFEGLSQEGEEALACGDPAGAAARLREALGLWRGTALAEFSFAAFARAAGARLEELRLAALEKRIEADLALGRHAGLVADLEALTAEHPFRERLRYQLMLALYRAGRQAEALAAYQDARRLLVDELGLEPGEPLQALERAILRQDPDLVHAEAAAGAQPVRSTAWSLAPPERSILIVTAALQELDALLAIAEPLTRRPRREIIVAALVQDNEELDEAATYVEQRRTALAARGVHARAAAFTTDAWGSDVVRLASEQDVDLLIAHSPSTLLAAGHLDDAFESVLEEAPCDVALLVPRDAADSETATGRPIIVPFGGADHEWSAVEIGAWIASASGATLRLLGSAADPAHGKRDASRLLAGVSLVVQRAVGIPTSPLLVAPGEEELLRAAEEAGLLIIGLSERWRHEGLGSVRLALARSARPPVLLVRRGLRPGGLAPVEGLSRYTWSLAHEGE